MSTTETAASAAALVTYLYCEAELSETKAKRLRHQADALALQFGEPCSSDLAAAYAGSGNVAPSLMALLASSNNHDGSGAAIAAAAAAAASEMAPLDEFGVPKYKGKKRGRKPKPRQRQHNPNRKKRSHTAYTLFVQENYPAVRAQYPNLQSKDIISLVAQQWKTISDMEKQAWKQRAIATAVIDEEGLDEDEEGDNAHAAAVAAAATIVGEGDDDDDDDDDDDEHQDHDEEQFAHAYQDQGGDEEQSGSDHHEGRAEPKKKRGRPKKK